MTALSEMRRGGSRIHSKSYCFISELLFSAISTSLSISLGHTNALIIQVTKHIWKGVGVSSEDVKNQNLWQIPLINSKHTLQELRSTQSTSKPVIPDTSRLHSEPLSIRTWLRFACSSASLWPRNVSFNRPSSAKGRLHSQSSGFWLTLTLTQSSIHLDLGCESPHAAQWSWQTGRDCCSASTLLSWAKFFGHIYKLIRCYIVIIVSIITASELSNSWPDNFSNKVRRAHSITSP